MIEEFGRKVGISLKQSVLPYLLLLKCESVAAGIIDEAPKQDTRTRTLTCKKQKHSYENVLLAVTKTCY